MNQCSLKIFILPHPNILHDSEKLAFKVAEDCYFTRKHTDLILSHPNILHDSKKIAFNVAEDCYY